MDVRSEKNKMKLEIIHNYTIKKYHIMSSIYDIALAVGSYLGLHVVNSEKDAKNS